jgi:signal transduction histidine kinase
LQGRLVRNLCSIRCSSQGPTSPNNYVPILSENAGACFPKPLALPNRKQFMKSLSQDPVADVARALAIETGFAILLTRLAEAARDVVLEERNRLAGEIHDSFTQLFAGIAMQLAVAEEEIAAGEGSPLCRVRLANEMAAFGLAEARRSAFSLRSTVIEETGLVAALQKLVERSNVTGRLRCDFRANLISEEGLPTRVQHELLRIAQEAIGNAIHHGRPTIVIVTLDWKPPNLILQIKDNGFGIPKTRLTKGEGMGLRSMRERAAQIDAKLDIQTGPGHGTRIIVTVPV